MPSVKALHATAKTPEPPGNGNPPSGGAQLSTANLLKLVSRWGRTRTTSTHTQPRLTFLLVRREVWLVVSSPLRGQLNEQTMGFRRGVR